MSAEKYQANRGEDYNNDQASDSSKKTAKLAAKGAADYFTGGKGGAVVDKLADTKLGNDILNKAGKAIDQNPLLKKAAEELDNQGALDAADTAMSAVESGKTGGTSQNSGIEKATMDASKTKVFSSGVEGKGDGNLDGTASAGGDVISFTDPKLLIKIALGVLGVFLLIIISFITIISGTDENGIDPAEKDENGNSQTSSGTSCIYDIKGFSNGSSNYNVKIDSANIKVRLLECGGYTPVSGEELVDFEKYILGVTYQENGGGSDEAIKAQAVAARSYSLSRPSTMGGAYGLKLAKEGNIWVLQLRACTNDQAYCDPDKGCWGGATGGEGGTIHTGYDPSKSWTRKPLPSDSKIRTLVTETAGEVVVDSKGYILNTAYRDYDQNAWNSMTNLNYKQILLQHYNSTRNIGARDIAKMNCTYEDINGGGGSVGTTSTGSFSNWKQGDPAWSGIHLGSSSRTIGSSGCLVTSISMLIKKSGVETKVNPFNPGTFVQALNQNGGFVGADFYWGKTTTVAPGFVYQDKMYIKNMSKQEKFNRIKGLLEQGYYVVAEVKGDTGQHWVAIDGIQGNDVLMMDPASNSKIMWNQYNPVNTSTLGYYKVS